MYIEVLPFILSEINVHSSAQVNPNAKLAEEIIEGQCRDLGIWIPQLKDYTTMSAYLYPHAGLQRLITIGLYMNFLFFVDDTYDRHFKDRDAINDQIAMRKVFDSCTNILLKGIAPDDTHLLYDVCFELRRQFLENGSEAWLRRLVHSTLAHLKSTTYTIDDIINNNGDVVNDYIALRVLDAGMNPTIDCLEFARNIFVPDAIINHEYLRQLRSYVGKIGALSNDLFSFTKEIIGTQSRFNLVCVLMDYDQLSFQQAVRRSVEIINDCIDEFHQYAKMSPKWETKEIDRSVRQYIEGLNDQIVASWHWQISTNRYRSPDSPFPELRTPL